MPDESAVKRKGLFLPPFGAPSLRDIAARYVYSQQFRYRRTHIIATITSNHIRIQGPEHMYTMYIFIDKENRDVLTLFGSGSIAHVRRTVKKK